MSHAKQVLVSMTRREALQVGIGSTVSAAVAATGVWAADRSPDGRLAEKLNLW